MFRRRQSGTARSRRAAAALLWGLLLYLGGELAFRTYVQRHVAVRDAEFDAKITRLRARIAERPRRPLVLVLGSSRVMAGLRPDALTLGNDGPLVFNMGALGCGPVNMHVCLRRLLDAGIRPDRVVFECWTPLWTLLACAEESLSNRERTPGDFRYRDARLLADYAAQPRTMLAEWTVMQLALVGQHRRWLMVRAWPDWGPTDTLGPYLAQMDAYGWIAYPEASAEDRRQAAKANGGLYCPRLSTGNIWPQASEAMHNLLELCRAEGIPAALVVLPEGSDVRAWYPPDLRGKTEHILADLAQTYQVPVLDAHTWAEDDLFSDCIHLNDRGATAFTTRFGRELLLPWLAGQTPAPYPARPESSPGPHVLGIGRR